MERTTRTDRENTITAFAEARKVGSRGHTLVKGDRISFGITTQFERNLLKYKNQELAEAVYETGLNPSAFSRLNNLPTTELYGFLYDRIPPLVSFGEGRRITTWSSPAQIIATALDRNPEDVFVKYAKFITGNPREGAMADRCNCDKVELDELNELVRMVLSTLNRNERFVIERRFGLGQHSVMTLQEVADESGKTRERIRQIEAMALRKLRHPSRVKYISDVIYYKVA